MHLTDDLHLAFEIFNIINKVYVKMSQVCFKVTSRSHCLHRGTCYNIRCLLAMFSLSYQSLSL